jgi:outer membrane protein assembly factor BamB
MRLSEISRWRKGVPRAPAWLLWVLLGTSAQAEPSARWPAWRGPDATGSAENGTFPIKWNAASPVWKVELPGKGCSTPAVWDSRIFLTAPSNGLDAVLAFDFAGKPLWLTTLGPERPGQHRNGSGCNPSPATDGFSVFVYFKSGDLAALDFTGKVRWQTNLVEAFGPDTLFWDQGTSPLLSERDVIIARMHHGESWLAAFSKATGEIHWKVARNYETAEEDDHAYTTPLLIRQQGREVVLTWGGEHLTGHDAADGHLLWSHGGFNPDSVPNWPAVASSVVAGDVAVVATGRADRGKPLLYGVKLGENGDVRQSIRLWRRTDTSTFVPTPSVYQGRVYLLRDRGEVECLDPQTGQTLWHGVLPKASSNYYASPLVAEGKLYAAREDGAVFVVRTDGPFEVLAENAMGERIIASPVPLANRLLLRGERHLFCVGSD